MALYDERQPGESTKAWRAFTFYRDLPTSERSIHAAWRKANKRKRGEASSRWELWSRTHGWVDRAAAYEQHLDDLTRGLSEARLVKVAGRMMDFETENQDRAEALVATLGDAIAKQAALPATDIERTEDKEVTAAETGAITVTSVKTRVKGIRIAGFARTADSYMRAMKHAVNPRREPGEKASGYQQLGPKAPLPEFMRWSIEDARREREQKKLADAKK